MPWPKILSSFKSPTTDGWSGRVNKDKRREVLLRSNLVNGDEKLADAILNAATIQVFSARSLIISADDTDDCAYIILEGTVSVRVNGQLVDKKGQSDSIGELAARRAGSPRTADVRVSSSKLVVLKLEGRKFRALLEQHETFGTNLESLIDSMNREKIAQLGQRRLPVNYLFVAATVAFMSGIASYLLIAHMGIALIVSATAFLLAQTLNPAFSYRLMAKSVLGALIGYIFLGGASWGWNASGNLFVPIGVDVAANGSVDFPTFVAGLVALVLALGLCVLADRLTNR